MGKSSSHYTATWFKQRGLEKPKKGVFKVVFADYFARLQFIRDSVIADLYAGNKISEARLRYLTTKEIKKHPQFRQQWEQAKLAWAVRGTAMWVNARIARKFELKHGKKYFRPIKKPGRPKYVKGVLFASVPRERRAEARKHLRRLLERHSAKGRDVSPGTPLYASLVGNAAQLSDPQNNPNYVCKVPAWFRRLASRRDRVFWMKRAVAMGLMTQMEYERMCPWRLNRERFKKRDQSQIPDEPRYHSVVEANY